MKTLNLFRKIIELKNKSMVIITDKYAIKEISNLTDFLTMHNSSVDENCKNSSR